MTDIIIAGGGPAGLSAAVFALRAGKSVKIIEKETFGGQVNFSPKIENYPGFLQITGAELADKLTQHALEKGADIDIEEVKKIEKNADTFTVITDCASHECKAVIIATGAQHRHLGIPGEEQYLGKGISFCAVCDGAFYAEKTVVVIGGGNSALQEAILLSETSEKVIMVQDKPCFTGEQRLIDIIEKRENIESIFNAEVKEFFGDEKEVKGIVVSDKTSGNEFKVFGDGIFEAIGLIPANECFADIAELENGYIKSDESCLTSASGIFTAGDCRTKSVRKIATAIADGAVAALAACDYLA